MTPNRARYLISNLLPGGAIRRAFHLPGGGDSIHSDGMTRTEFVQAKEYWATMPGGSTFFSALCEIARMDDLPEAGGGHGYPGPCPEGMDWSAWLAFNNVD